MIPNDEQRRFILEKLIPFVEREHGHGFGMNIWFKNLKPGELIIRDGLERLVPPCGMICCLGGSIEFLLGGAPQRTLFFLDEARIKRAADAIGLTRDEAIALFFYWHPKDGRIGAADRWPDSYAWRFNDAKTTEGKAAIAVELLREIAEKGGEILHWEG